MSILRALGNDMARIFGGPQPDAEADMAEAINGICVAAEDHPLPTTWQLGDDDDQFCNEHGMWHSMELRDPTCVFDGIPCPRDPMRELSNDED